MQLPSARPEERIILDFGVSGWYTFIQILAALGIILVAELFYLLLSYLGFFPEEMFEGVQYLFLGLGFLISLYLLSGAIYLRLARRYFITTERVLQINGWLAQKSVSVDYPTITDLTVDQDVFERFITRTGTVFVDTAGSPTEEISLHHVAEPIALRDQILELVEKARSSTSFSPITTRATTRVAPSDVNFPIKTNPDVVDTDNDGEIDDEENRK